MKTPGIQDTQTYKEQTLRETKKGGNKITELN